MSTESVQVAVRVRPFNQRELDRDATCIIRMDGPKTTIINPETNDEKDFAFDFSYWSHDGFDVLEEPEDDLGLPGGGYNAPANRRGGKTSSQFGAEYCGQKEVFDVLGVGVLDNALSGYNCCLFAYGQTGSGKSYSFVGYGSNKGVVPQVCDEIFKRKVSIEASGATELQVTFSMMEIYNEKIRDLLNPDPKTNNDLKVRTSKQGTYVQGAKPMAVSSYAAISAAMNAGTASRTVASTLMNATSSRAHTIMAISVKQITKENGVKREVASDMNLVDLAGSERAESTGATGDRLKEGAAINSSLSALGNVISALAEQANNPKKKVFVPYRDSKLTQILQSALGGNSKTIMVAALSPADINFEETLSTLRYADRAKQIKVIVQVQENPTDKFIRELKEENERLRRMVDGFGFGGDLEALQSKEAAPLQGAVTVEQIQVAIEKAVAEVRGVSAEEKARAVAVVKQELAIRADGADHQMIPRYEVVQTLTDVMASADAPQADKDRALAETVKGLEDVSAQRATSGEPDLYTCEQVKEHVKELVKASNCSDDDCGKLIIAAEQRFDQQVLDSLDDVVDKGAIKAIVTALSLMTTLKGEDAHALQTAVIKESGLDAASDADADSAARAKQQITNAFLNNKKKMHEVEGDFASRVEESNASAQALYKSLGLVDLNGMSEEERRVTPSLHNLNQDPFMTDSLVYYLRPGDTVISGPGAIDDDTTIVLSGQYVVEGHGTIRFAAGDALSIVYIKGNGQAFINGQPVRDAMTPLAHNDRVIVGETQVFRVVNPLDPQASAKRQIIDWELAQTELAEGLGHTVNLKVDEEAAKRAAELEKQLVAMQEKFARENASLRKQLSGDSPMIRQLNKRAEAIDNFKERVGRHMSEYKRELIRLENGLRNAMPILREANNIAKQLGRDVLFDPEFYIEVPEYTTLSPVEELLTTKRTELLVRVIMTNTASSAKREWFWTVDDFYDKVGDMRIIWQICMNDREKPPAQRVGSTLSVHSEDDPFWAAPFSQFVGNAYLYLAPVAYGVSLEQWISIVDYRGEPKGELCVAINTNTMPSDDPDQLLGKSAAFDMVILEARGLTDSPNQKVIVSWQIASEPYRRTTAAAPGGDGTATWQETHEVQLMGESVSKGLGQTMVDYLSCDAITLSLFATGEDVTEVGSGVMDATINIRDGTSDEYAKTTKEVMGEHSDDVDRLKCALVADCARQYGLLAQQALMVNLNIRESLELWQLPSELTGVEVVDDDNLPDDPEELKQMVRKLRVELARANILIKDLKSPTQGSRKATGGKSLTSVVPGAQSEEVKSSACVIL